MFKKGESGNPAGRPKGAKTRSSEELREVLKSFIDSNFENLQTAYDSLEPKEKLKFFNDVLRFVLSPAIQPERLSEAQLEQIIIYFRNKQENEEQ